MGFVPFIITVPPISKPPVEERVMGALALVAARAVRGYMRRREVVRKERDASPWKGLRKLFLVCCFMFKSLAPRRDFHQQERKETKK